MNLRESAIGVAKKLFIELEKACDGSYVGEEAQKDFEFGGNTYIVKITAFWESCRHFSMSILGTDISGTYEYRA